MIADAARRKAGHAPVSGAYARVLLRRFGATPEERARLLEGTGLDEHALSAVGSEAPFPALLVLAANLTRIHGPTWPLDAAPAWSAPIQGALDVAIRSAPNGDEAMRIAACYGRVRAPYIAFSLESHDAARCLVMTIDAPWDDIVWRAIAEAVALSINALFAQVFEDGFRQTAVDFPWPPPPHAARLRAAFACTLRFDRPDFAFEAGTDLCRHPAPLADPALHASAVAELEASARRMDGGRTLARELERMIAADLPRRLGAEEAARRLGLSRRTLVRRLAAEGAAFRALLDGALRERARALMRDKALKRDAIAESLGYADSTSFSRACRRWFGPTPR